MSALTSDLSFAFIDCANCGASVVGNKNNIKIPPKGKANMGRAVFFPFSWTGFLSNKTGLEITTPEKKKYKVLSSGAFKITFKAGENPQIDSTEHSCEVKSKLSEQEILALWEKDGAKYFNPHIMTQEDYKSALSRTDQTSDTAVKSDSSATKKNSASDDIDDLPAKRLKPVTNNHFC